MSRTDPIITITRRLHGREQTAGVRPWHLLAAAIGIGLVYSAVAVFGLALPVDLGAFEAPRQRMERRIQAMDVSLQSMKRDEAAARARAGLDPVTGDILKLGVGGADLPPAADPLEEKLGALSVECELRKASYREVIARLRARRELWDRIPLISPVRTGYVSSRFGPRPDPFTNEPTRHLGLDIRADLGTPVYAAAAGIVRMAERQSGYGLVVVVDHENGLETRYAHNGALLVHEGDSVSRGQFIARVGNSGRVTAPHLHYEVRQSGVAIDPVRFLTVDLGELE